MAKKKEGKPFERVGCGIKPKDPIAQAMINLILQEAYPDERELYPLVDNNLKLSEHMLGFPDRKQRDISFSILTAAYGNLDDELYVQAVFLAAMGA